MLLRQGLRCLVFVSAVALPVRATFQLWRIAFRPPEWWKTRVRRFTQSTLTPKPRLTPLPPRNFKSMCLCIALLCLAITCTTLQLMDRLVPCLLQYKEVSLGFRRNSVRRFAHKSLGRAGCWLVGWLVGWLMSGCQLHCLQSYWLTGSWIAVLENPVVSQLGKKFPFLYNPNVHYLIYKSPKVEP